jgi:long-subunit acyl-CoA synthetase (AMP-forming)
MEIYTSDINQPVKIIKKDGDIEPITMVNLFNKTVEEFPDRDALAYRDSSGVWHKINYREYKNRVEKIAKVFIKLGLKERGVVSILAWNSAEWLISALAAIHAG